MICELKGLIKEVDYEYDKFSVDDYYVLGENDWEVQLGLYFDEYASEAKFISETPKGHEGDINCLVTIMIINALPRVFVYSSRDI